MRKELIIATTVLILVALSFISYQTITGKAILETKELPHYTRAICNETKFCQDNIIYCKDNKVEAIVPIQGAVIQQFKEWKDPRENVSPEDFCIDFN